MGRRLAKVADSCGVLLGVETEASNVVNTPARARRFMDEVGSDRIGIILDPANLFQIGEADTVNVRGILDKAFAYLGKDIILAHGKDILAGPGLAFTAAGKGIVDFDYMLKLLAESGYEGGMILHGIKNPADIAGCVAFMRKKL